jgi:hypothetical protein
MSAQDRYTKVIESLVNGDEAKASDLLHEAFVEKARDIWADLVEQDEIVEDDVETELDEEFGDEESGDFLDDLETDESEIESEEAFGEDDDEPEMDMDADMDAEMELATDDEGEEGDEADDAEEMDMDGDADDKIEAEFASVEDALNDLKATFAEIMGDEEPAEEAVAFESEDDLEEAKDEELDESDEEVEESADDDDEKLDEAAELQKIGKDKAVHPVDMPAGDDGKASPVGPGTDDIESNGGPVSTDTKNPAPVKVATAKDMGITHPGDGAKLKPETRGHGAEKKGKAE